MVNLLPYIQIILAVLMVATILIQRSGAGAGGAFGSDNWNAGYHTKRGFEKVIFNATIILAVLFALTSLAALILKQ